jgi:anti-sigma regulatory factor (Ser/Thr protein kinase)
VVVTLEDDRWAPLEAALGGRADEVDRFIAGDRYARPPVAFSTLCDYVAQAQAEGATQVWSIGEIGFDGALPAADWLRYEHAVTELMVDLPVRAVCMYDTSTLGAPILALACSAHLHHRGDVTGARSGTSASDVLEGAAPAVPDRRPDLDLPVSSDTARLRASLRSLLHVRVDRVAIEEIELVATELATNAHRHGMAPARVQAWLTDEGLTVRVSDAGPGPSSPYPELNRPDGRVGGLGLWISGQLSDRLTFSHDAAGWAVTASFRPSPRSD